MSGWTLDMLLSRVTRQPLWVSGEFRDALLSVLARRVRGERLSREEALAACTARTYSGPESPSAAEMRREGELYFRTDSGVAVISIAGALTKEPAPEFLSSLGEGGLSSYAEIEDALHAASGDHLVRGVMLSISSPGGETGGCPELAERIAEMAQRMPVGVFADGTMCSAAYALGARGTRGLLFASPTAWVGSIGTILTLADWSKAYEAMGVSHTTIATGRFKDTGSELRPIDDDEREYLRERVDALNGLLVSGVAAGRGARAEALLALEARVFVGAEALRPAQGVSLIDHIGTFEEALAAVENAASSTEKTSMGIRSRLNGRAVRAEDTDKDTDKETDKEFPPEESVTVEMLRNAYPNLCKQMEGGGEEEEEKKKEEEPASLTALKSAFPGEAEFVLEQAEKRATMAQAHVAMVAHLRDRVASLNTELVAARGAVQTAAGGKAKPLALAQAADVARSLPEGGDPASVWDAREDVRKAYCKAFPQAAAMTAAAQRSAFARWAEIERQAQAEGSGKGYLAALGLTAAA